MKLQDLLLPLTLAVVSTLAIQYFFFPRQGEKKVDIASDKSFTAPTSVQAMEPLDIEVDFFDAPAPGPAQLTEVSTPLSILRFSSYGAIIEFMGYKRMLAGKEGLIETVVPLASREKGAFLVALNGLGNTPYYYTLLERKDQDKVTMLSYVGESKTAKITKQFFVHHDTYKIDLKITLEPKEHTSLRPRLFFPGPLMTGAIASEVLKAVFYTEKKTIEKVPVKDLAQFGKENPSLFGLEDRYFINVLIADPQGFARRAYFRIQPDVVDAVLQDSLVDKPTTWELSFYCGPKEMQALSAADKRLEGVLYSGWLASLSKLLLYLLNFFYSVLKNYGLAIIALTFLLRLILAPFTIQGQQAQKKQQEIQRKLQYLEQKHKHDPQLLARERADVLRKQAMPGMLGCLPLLAQIPIFFGLQQVLAHAIELYKAPFLWIKDLSEPDPYYILPALIGVSMALQMAQTGDPRQRVANILISIIFAAVTANLSAGLALFIFVSTFLGLAQSYIQKALKL
jgi:YidC/Oxa1 family membrane protein insertase